MSKPIFPYIPVVGRKVLAVHSRSVLHGQRCTPLAGLDSRTSAGEKGRDELVAMQSVC
jgi:hypothetical protein